MTSMRDLTRLFNGISLVANEIAKRSLPATTSNFETLIKNTLLSVTDISGITKGKLRQFSPPQPSSSSSYNTTHASSDSPSVVVFSDHPSSPPESTVPPPPIAATTIETVTNNDIVADFSYDANLREEHSDATVRARAVAANESEIVSSTETLKQGATTSEEVPLRKRRPRERKVPATPFSRALGLVFFNLIFSDSFYMISIHCVSA